MKVKVFVRVMGLATGMGLLTAAPVPAGGAGPKEAEKPLAALIQDLASDVFRSREEASQKIWKIGGAALPALEAILKGNDPEQAHRARELIWKIQYRLTPETDPEVVKLVEQYAKASPDAKVNLFAVLSRKQAWWQLLKLYVGETDTELQTQLQQPLRNLPGGRGIGGVAVIAAREKLQAGDAKAAREFLEMAPADAEGLLALADFHRSQGTLEAELKRAKTLTGEPAAAWQLALYRASGRLEEAKSAADAAGETKISAVLCMLLGDPLPWMQLPAGEGHDSSPFQATYSALAIRRWQGKAGAPAAEAKEILGLKTRNERDRLCAISTLFLLGHREAAEAASLRVSPSETFNYFDIMERIPEALKALGLDPAKPDYLGYVAERFKDSLEQDKPEEAIDPEEDDEQNSRQTSLQNELAALADFLERRGLQQVCDDAYLPHLATMAAADEPAFLKLLAHFFRSGAYGEKPASSSRMAHRAAMAWAENQPDRWDSLVATVFGKEEGPTLWNWLEVIKPTASLSDRFEGMLTLNDIGKDPSGTREKWLDHVWEFLAQTPPEKRQAETATFIAIFDRLSMDAASRLKLGTLISAEKPENTGLKIYPLYLETAGRWKEAGELYLSHIDTLDPSRAESNLALIAHAAACLRRAGLAKEAAVQDALVDKLALGSDALVIALAYYRSTDYSHARTWFQRAAIQCNPADLGPLSLILQYLLPELFELGKWQEAAAIAEVCAHLTSHQPQTILASNVALTFRLQSDLGRALADLKTDRPAALALLDRCRTMIPSDGTLADDFFPALRRAGLMKEHDAWFEDSWQRIGEVIAQFPDSDNTCNTAAWLAARGQRHLDEAEKLERHALAINPDQPAYLDTMAEIHFVKGNRTKALEWSAQAVNFAPADYALRRQQERFRTAPLPR